jgi:hypothetical protein
MKIQILGMGCPKLAVDGQVKSIGRIPNKDQIVSILNEGK